MKSLLTGGNAFVARAIGPALVAAGHQLTVCLRPGRPMPDWLTGLGDRAATQWVDLATDAGLESLVAGQDMIVHAAGRVEDPRTSAALFERDNTRTTQALITGALAVGCPRIINFSSMSIYGSIESSPVDASTPSIRPTLYGASKLAAENALSRAAPDLASISLRLPGIVGPLAHGNWLSRCRVALRSDAPVTIANPDFQFNNVVHVDDVAAFVVALCQRDWTGASAFPIAAGTPMAIADLISMMRTAIGSASTINVTSDDRRPFAISSDLAVRAFGYRPTAVRDIITRFAKEA